jgi:outer membrane protein, heavy metal efflux system
MVALSTSVLSGCAHSDQDHVALSAAQNLASLPRDQVAQEVLNTPKPPSEVKQLPHIKVEPDAIKLPPSLPGADALPLVLPQLEKLPTQQAKEKAIEAAFPKLPPLDQEPVPVPGPGGGPLDLPALQGMALANNPLVQQAASDVQAARGGMIQAGLHPNPNIGYEGDQINSSRTSGQQGGFIEQTFKTGHKLELARSVGSMDVRNAELALRKTQVDVMSQVRSGYFAVLVAHENLAIARAMSTLADESYRLQLHLLEGGQAAAYEPLQLYVLCVQARASVVQADNRYLAAWHQLAASLGQPDLPPTQLAGRADVLAPGYDFGPLRDFILANHTDVAAARNSIQKARYYLDLQRALPIPDINTRVVIQYDDTGNPHEVQAGAVLGIALPVFDRNQGNILQAEAILAHQNREVARVENDLSQRLAEAYERYRNNLIQVAYYRNSILPNQVRVYRALYQRYHNEPGKVQYSDIVVAQQTLAQALQTYVQSLSAQWQAVVDLGALLQTDDLYYLSAPAASCQPLPQPVSQLLDCRTWAAAAPEAPLAEKTPRVTMPAPVVREAPRVEAPSMAARPASPQPRLTFDPSQD